MSRGFDRFDFDDFRGSGFHSERDVGSGSSSAWDKWRALQDVHREEDRADRLEREKLERPREERPTLPREERVQAILKQRIRAKYTDRGTDYSLRDSEIHALGEVGKFRIVAINDLAEFAYNGDRSRAESDVENLARQGLIRQTGIADTEHSLTQVVSLTKQGHRLLSGGRVVPSRQATYHGLKKPKEAFHDADLYRLYHKASDEIEARGGRVHRVLLDYELKQELYARLARASKHGERDSPTLKEEIAERFHLQVVSGKIPIPDLRIEYTNENDTEIQRRDLELTTEHYRPRGLSQKARAGFQLYAREQEADRLRRIRDDLELSSAILRL